MLPNTNHRGQSVGAPHVPTTQASQASAHGFTESATERGTAHSSLPAPNAGISPSFGDTPSSIIKSAGFGDAIRAGIKSFADNAREPRED